MKTLYWQILRFEINFHCRQPLIYIVSGLFFLLAFAGTASESVTIGGSGRNLDLNASFIIMQTMAVFSIIGMFTAVAFAANPVLRDFELKTAEFFYTTKVDKFSYLMGRFTAAFIFSYLTMIMASLGVLAGEMMPWLDQERIGNTHWAAYFFIHWAIVLPNCFIMASLFFCAATLTRSLFGVYLVSVALIILYSIISSFTDPDLIKMTSIADPFGLISFFTDTRYWTVFDRNSRVPEFSGELMHNRLLWLGIASIVMLLAYRKFPFSIESPFPQRWWHRKKKDKTETAIVAPDLIKVAPKFDRYSLLQQLKSQTFLEARITLKSIPFIVLVLFGIFNLVAGSMGMIGNLFGTSVYPVTGLMVRVIQGAYLMMIMIVVIYYSGELVNRDRALGLSGIIDSAPWPNWIMAVAKLIALFLVIIAMLIAAIVTGVVIQIFHQYYTFEIGLYIIGLIGIAAIPFYLAAVLGIAVNAIVQNKYLGILIMTLYMISLFALPGAGYPHQLYRFTVDNVLYSDINGFGHYLTQTLWFTLYWCCFAVLLMVISHLLWARGEVQGFKQRLKLLRDRFSAPVRAVTVVATMSFIGLGVFIFYNTNILNRYETREDLEEIQANYEKSYKQYEFLPQPSIVDTKVDVDIYPRDRKVVSRGTYRLINETDHPIEQLHVLIPRTVELEKFELATSTLSDNNDDNYRIYNLSPPLIPGGSLEMTFETHWLNEGFVNHGSSTRVVYNGTFFNNSEAFPIIGYSRSFEIGDNNKRRKYELEPIQRAPDIDDSQAHQRAYFGNWHRGNFETTVSTSIDQIAMAPGYLVREWTEGERRYFHYKMDAPIWNFYAYLSQDYKIIRDKWEGIDKTVDLEIYYHHDFNVDTMLRSTKDSLDYFSANFGPYQYRQFRILEFPAYATFAQSFPNTIPFSEAIGFIADLRDPEKIDYVYYVTAHELAHQWWAHQVISADTQGAAVLVETLSQYSALMVMEQTFGKDHMHRFLKYELDRYLTGRGGEIIEEQPLMLVENQGYIHYRKGSVVMYALKDAIGAPAINRALKRLVDNYAFSGAPYPTSKTLISYLRDEVGEEHQQLITDLFENIVLYDLKANEVAMRKLPDDRYEVSLNISARKYLATGDGQEREVPISGTFDIAILGEEQGDSKISKVLYLQKEVFTENSREFKIIVDEKPVSAGIDPWFKQIDRVPTDNVKSL